MRALPMLTAIMITTAFWSPLVWAPMRVTCRACRSALSPPRLKDTSSLLLRPRVLLKHALVFKVCLMRSTARVRRYMRDRRAGHLWQQRRRLPPRQSAPHPQPVRRRLRYRGAVLDYQRSHHAIRVHVKTLGFALEPAVFTAAIWLTTLYAHKHLVELDCAFPERA